MKSARGGDPRRWAQQAVDAIGRDLHEEFGDHVRLSVSNKRKIPVGMVFPPMLPLPSDSTWWCVVEIEGEPAQNLAVDPERIEEVLTNRSPPQFVLASLADFVQELLMESSIGWGKPWPQCPRHEQHPLWIDEFRDEPTWLCREDPSINIPAGHLSELQV